MRKREMGKFMGAAVKTLVAFVFLWSQCAWAGQSQKAKGSANAAPAAAREDAAGEGAHQAGGPHEGIKVHGHWSIEVRNPDGAVVTHREFENSLAPPGATLSAVLSRGGTAGAWQVWVENVVGGGTASGLCAHLEQNTTECIIGEPGSIFSVPASTNLVVATPSGKFGGIVTLSGSVQVTGAGTVNSVETFFATCPPTVTPSACPTSTTSNGGIAFTSAGVSPPVSVAVGQTIAVIVTISFS